MSTNPKLLEDPKLIKDLQDLTKRPITIITPITENGVDCEICKSLEENGKAEWYTGEYNLCSKHTMELAKTIASRGDKFNSNN